MHEFSNTELWLLISFVANIVTIISAIIAFYQASKNKKELKSRKYILDFIKQNAEISDKKEELEKINIQIENSEVIINDIIPKEANRIAMRELLDNETNNLIECYRKVQDIQSEIDENNDNELDNELINLIRKKIEPKYTSKRLQNLLISLFLFLTIIGSIIGNSGLVFFQFIIAGKIILISIKNNYTKQEIERGKCFIFQIVSVIFLIMASILLLVFLKGNDILDSFVVIILIFLFYILHILFAYLFIHKQLKKRKIFLSIVFLTFIAFLLLFIEIEILLWPLLLFITVMLIFDLSYCVFAIISYIF